MPQASCLASNMLARNKIAGHASPQESFNSSFGSWSDPAVSLFFRFLRPVSYPALVNCGNKGSLAPLLCSLKLSCGPASHGKGASGLGAAGVDRAA